VGFLRLRARKMHRRLCVITPPRQTCCRTTEHQLVGPEQFVSHVAGVTPSRRRQRCG